MVRLFFLILFISRLGSALAYHSVASDLYPFLDIQEISQKLGVFQFFEMDLTKKGNIFNNSFAQAYLNAENVSQVAILKFDLQLDSGQTILKLSDSEFICHGKTSRDRFFSLYTKGQKFSDFEKVCARLNEKTIFSFKNFLIKKIVPDAQAAKATCPGDNPNLNDLAAVSNQLTELTFTQRISTCAIEAVRSALKTYTGAVEGAVSIVTNPSELWAQISQQALALKEFVLHLKSEALALFNSMQNMDGELIISLGCQLAGELLASSSLAALGGVGFAKLTQKLVQIFNRLSSNTTLLARLSNLARKGHPETAKGILSCAINK